MPLSVSKIKEILAPWRLIILTSKGAIRFKRETGYAGEMTDQGFEFLEVTNKDDHFSNISAPPETKIHRIRYEDVVDLERHP